jgi:hypothetical protein
VTHQSTDFADDTQAHAAVRPGTLLLLGIMLFTGWAFLPTLQNGFVDWDEKTLVNNLAYRGFGWPELRWMFASFHFGAYQPLTWLTFGLDYVVWWADPFGYHWTNLLLHAGNTAGVYLLTVRLFSFWRSDIPQPGNDILRFAAALSALVFAIHPLRVEPVAWVSARSDILATLFFLCSVLFYLRAVQTGPGNRGRMLWMTLSVSAYCLSLLSGMSGIALPGILLVLDVYPLRRLAGLGNWLSPEARRLYKEKIFYLLSALVGVTVAVIAGNGESFVGEASSEPAVMAIARCVAAPVFHFWKAFVPFGLSPAYELPGWTLSLGALATLAVSMGLYFVRKRWPSLLASWICYVMLLWLVPTNHSPGLEMLADRRTYLPCIPWTVLAGAATVCCWQAYANGQIGAWLWFSGIGVSTMILLGLGALTGAQTRVWHDAETMEERRWKRCK